MIEIVLLFLSTFGVVEPLPAPHTEQAEAGEEDGFNLRDQEALSDIPSYAELECYIECMQYCLWSGKPDTGGLNPLDNRRHDAG